MSFGIYEAAYKKGWDPDNVIAPLITAMGDLITLPSLLAAAFFIIQIKQYTDLFAYSIGLVAIVLFLITARSKKEYPGISSEHFKKQKIERYRVSDKRG